MINPKHRFPQSLLGITTDKSHNSLQLPKSVFYKFSFVRAAPFFILHFSFFILHLKSCLKFPPCIISAINLRPSFSLGSQIIQGAQLFFFNCCPIAVNCCSPTPSACGPISFNSRLICGNSRSLLSSDCGQISFNCCPIIRSLLIS